MTYMAAKMQGKSEIKSAYGYHSFFFSLFKYKSSTLAKRKMLATPTIPCWIVNSEWKLQEVGAKILHYNSAMSLRIALTKLWSEPQQ
ncbi:MAG: hypothetical protein PVJ77_09535, partial [Desulfobacterales bacterium]